MADLAKLLQEQQRQADMMRQLTGELPGLNQAKAQAAQLQNQPMIPTGMLAPQDKTPFGEMRQLSPEELAAKGAVTVPTTGFSNPNLRGSNVNRFVPYYAAKHVQEGGMDISPEMIKAYQDAGLTKLIAERGGNNPVVVEHEVSHDRYRDEMKNRRKIYERFAGKPEGSLAEAQYLLGKEQLDPSGNPFAYGLKQAAFPRVGNPKYAESAEAVKAYRNVEPEYWRKGK
jgi:hypothetical protein